MQIDSETVDQAGEAKERSEKPEPPGRQVITKFIVAVHGIGDQTTYDTIKSVAYRFFSFRNVPAAIPLGSFHTARVDDPCAPWLEVPTRPHPIKLGFTEAYWAPVPRSLVKAGYTLEESKRWAQTVVERFRLNYEKQSQAPRGARSMLQRLASPQLTKEDYSMVKRVLLEMMETIRVLERLVLLAEKAGLFKFDLRKLLDDFVGDVQVVADFQKPRSEILERFCNVMKSIHEAEGQAEIYIVAHSEGTVVSFLGLLKAMCNGGADSDWVKQVRGYMTIGSPIDKHVILWPELFRPYELPADPTKRAGDKARRVAPDHPIQWKNYYDYGDPVGFNLRTVRGWIKEHELEASFRFGEEDDIGFGRYWLPGKAHNDYWQDKQVFGHFIQNVVGIQPESRAGKTAPDFSRPPRGKLWAIAASYGLPYFLVVVLSFVSVFLLRKGVLECISPDSDPVGAFNVFRSVGLNALVLVGLTALAGIFRVTRTLGWRLIGAGLFALATIPYWLLQWNGSLARQHLGRFIDPQIASKPLVFGLVVLGAILLVELSNLVGRKYPSWGLKPLLVLVGAPVAALVAIVVSQQEDRDSLWPLVLAGAGALYLWWLAALILELVFIWHRYVRHEAAMDRLRETAA